MKKTTDFAQVVMVKKEMLDILTECMDVLDRLDKEARLEWRATGEKEQATRWNKEQECSMPVYYDDNGERTFEVTDKPVMVDCYDNLPKLEYSKQDEARLSAIQQVRETLASLA